MRTFATVDDYIAAQSAPAQPRLRELRAIIRAALPEAAEVISYGMPTYKFPAGSVYFGAAKRHCALYGSALDACAEELRAFDTTKGTVRFPLDQPIPEQLVHKLVVAKAAGEPNGSAITGLEDETREDVFEQCDRFLFGHGPQLPRAVLAELAEEAGPDERPDRYGEGSLIEGFERDIAALLGKEAAVFLPSGTMAQQIALRLWAEHRRSSTVAFHPTCHLEIHEQKGYELLHGLHGRLVGERSRLLTLDDLRATPGPLAALLLELPQREIGGQLPSWPDLEAQVAWARERDVAVHMDGARLWESGPFYERSYAEIAGLFDSVYVSFYKGIGAIAGAALTGSAAFISEARVWQRRHGGNLVQLYPFVLSARANLRRRLERFPGYHQRAQAVARVLCAIPGISVKPDPPQTNMMHVYLRAAPEALMDACVEIARTERVLLFRRMFPSGVPGIAAFELSIGDAAEALTDQEIEAYFRRIMATAGV